MDRCLTYDVPSEANGLRIEQYLHRQGYSRQARIQLKKFTDGVLLDGRPVFLTHRLLGGERLSVCLRESQPSPNIRPVCLPLSILYEDEDLLVVQKPAGMPIHPSLHNDENTLANALAWYYAHRGQTFVFRCCNRLDRDTSGLTIVAKNMLSAGILSERTALKEIRREYLGIARGSLPSSSGTIRAPLGRKPGSIIERVVDFERGERAVTHYRVLGEENGHSLIWLLLETGRTHQIRVHMQYLGFPLVGDYLYNPDREWIGRQALHAYRMSFAHPVTGRPMVFTAPLPQDMQRILPSYTPDRILSQLE